MNAGPFRSSAILRRSARSDEYPQYRLTTSCNAIHARLPSIHVTPPCWAAGDALAGGLSVR